MTWSSEPLCVRAEHLGLFETGVLHGRIEDSAALNDELGETIARRRAEDDGLQRSNVGGWHSDTGMTTWGGAAAERVADTAIRMAKRLSHFEARDPASVDWSVRMWANVSPAGALNMSHAHPGVLWAAVYYVDMGGTDGEDTGGELYFEDPRFPVPLMTFPGFRAMGTDGKPQPVERRLATRAGDMVLFPGWMRHGVRPHEGGRERISIAMNIYVKERAAA